MRVLIAGCGYVGTELGLRLAADGHDVWGLRRTPADLPSPIRPLAADLTVPATLDRLPSRLDSVVYAVSADASERAAYRAAYVTGLRDDLAEAIRHALDLATPSPLYLASDLEPARLREVLEWLAAGIDVPWESAADVRETIPGKRCVPRRLLDEGFAFAFPTWREGYRSVIGSTSRSGTGAQHIPDRPNGFQLDRYDSGRVVLR